MTTRNVNRPKTDAVFVTFAFSVVLLAGCGQRVGEVSGRVQYKGKAVTSGTVTMIGKDGVPHQTEINEAGTYRIKGVPTGDVSVLVASPPLEVANSARKEVRKDPKGQIVESKSTDLIATQAQKDSWRPIPIEYSDMSQRKLKATVNSGPNTHDINLD